MEKRFCGMNDFHMREREKTRIPLHFGVFMLYVVPNKAHHQSNGLEWVTTHQHSTIAAYWWKNRVNKFTKIQANIEIYVYFNTRISIFKIIQNNIHKSWEKQLRPRSVDLVLREMNKTPGENATFCVKQQTHQFNVILCHFGKNLVGRYYREEKKRSYSFTFHCPQCLNGLQRQPLQCYKTARERQINGERERKREKQERQLKTKLRIYLWILYVLRNVNCCTLLRVYTYERSTFISHQPIATNFAIIFCCCWQETSLSSLNKRYKSNIYAFAPFLWASACACTFFPFVDAFFFMKWWYTFCLHVMALFMPFL